MLYVVCLELWLFLCLLLLYFITSGALESSDHLLSYSVTTVALPLHITIILIITHLSFNP